MNEKKPADAPQRNPRQELKALRDRVGALEAEMQECRQLNKRLAEITDLVVEVLLPADQRDDARLLEALARYERAL